MYLLMYDILTLKGFGFLFLRLVCDQPVALHCSLFVLLEFPGPHRKPDCLLLNSGRAAAGGALLAEKWGCF